MSILWYIFIALSESVLQSVLTGYILPRDGVGSKWVALVVSEVGFSHKRLNPYRIVGGPLVKKLAPRGNV